MSIADRAYAAGRDRGLPESRAFRKSRTDKPWPAAAGAPRARAPAHPARPETDNGSETTPATLRAVEDYTSRLDGFKRLPHAISRRIRR
jgi:hypothetical protein